MLRSSGSNGAGNLQRRIVLLVLGGDPEGVRKILKRDYPEDLITEVSRADFEKRRSLLGRLELVRVHHPDLFAVSTERLAWQRGQNSFLLFGALAGAKHSVIMDAYGGWRQERRTSVLTSAPLKLLYEAALSATAIARARRELIRLERAVASPESKLISHQAKAAIASEPFRITYLRATPGAGTQLGGASSHIKGVTDAMLKLGAQLRVISNDELVSLDAAKTPLTIIGPESIGATRAAFDLRNSLIFYPRRGKGD